MDHQYQNVVIDTHAVDRYPCTCFNFSAWSIQDFNVSWRSSPVLRVSSLTLAFPPSLGNSSLTECQFHGSSVFVPVAHVVPLWALHYCIRLEQPQGKVSHPSTTKTPSLSHVVDSTAHCGPGEVVPDLCHPARITMTHPLSDGEQRVHTSRCLVWTFDKSTLHTNGDKRWSFTPSVTGHPALEAT